MASLPPEPTSLAYEERLHRKAPRDCVKIPLLQSGILNSPTALRCSALLCSAERGIELHCITHGLASSLTGRSPELENSPSVWSASLRAIQPSSQPASQLALATP
ncbi:hypothetical protein AXG93_2446s1050 [Marchantia polymorpha subsp. ruderalis]|uniref:Uncharacterized protein n=1 Tax=Marchantia polymorpha subsp. ruderalis TaxID=1480154 RepID=A0A176W7R3_MARPO|nr:hypothetical protein AXG93_2446s1050 [Marchantia polymorpha subsp. ruderalis]